MSHLPLRESAAAKDPVGPTGTAAENGDGGGREGDDGGKWGGEGRRREGKCEAGELVGKRRAHNKRL